MNYRHGETQNPHSKRSVKHCKKKALPARAKMISERRGHFSRRLSAGEVSVNERGYRAAQGIVDTAGAAGGDG